jgi:hypothetical protein
MEMSPVLKQIVKDEQDGVNKRDKKQAEIAGLKQYRSLIVTEMVVSTINNDSVPEERIALKQFLENDTDINSKFHLFDLNLTENNFHEAHATLETIEQMIETSDITYVAEMEDFISLQHILVDIEAGILTTEEAVANNMELISHIATNSSYPGQVSAQLLLDAAGIAEYEEVVKLPEPVSSNKNLFIEENQQPKNILMHDIINVYPNPASNKFYVEYAFPGERTNRNISIYTLNGNMIDIYVLTQNVGIFVYNKTLPSGTYLIKVGDNYTEKIVIQ